MLRSLIVFIPLLSAAAGQDGPPRHFSYAGADAAQWTSTALAPGRFAASTEFTVFPCDAAECSVSRVLVDAGGNSYVVGSRYFPVYVQGVAARAADVFVAKLDPAGATLFLATFSGKGNDQGQAIALDPAGNIFVGGTTSSPNFPLRNAIQPERSGSTGFLLKLSPDGGRLLFSTYFGGTAGMSSVRAMATDSAGNVYVTGQTASTDFPVTPGMPAGPVRGMGPSAVFAAFVAKLDPSGGRILYSGRISGNSVACGGGSTCFLSTRLISGDAIGVDNAGNAYVAGNSNVTDLPATEGALTRQGIGGWAARIAASGERMDWLTYIGAANYVLAPFAYPGNRVGGMAVDGAGNAHVVGRTNDPKFLATPGTVQPVYGGPADPPAIGPGPPGDAFVAKLNPQGTAMVYATYLGGAGEDAATAIALDSAGSAYVAGSTASSGFLAGRGSDFIAVLNPAGSALTFSSRYPGGSVSQAIAVDDDKRLRVAGATGLVSSLTPGAAPETRLLGIANAANGSLGPAVAPGEAVSLFGTGLGPEAGVEAAAGAGGRMPTELAGTQVFFDDVAAPLLYVSEDQVNAVTPFALVPGRNVTVRVQRGAAASPLFPGVVISYRPAIFGFGTAAALNEDGTVNSQANPAKPGSVVSMWVTGVGSVYPVPPDGQVTTEALDYRCCQVYVIGQTPAEVLYAGAAPGMVAGVVQINFRLPPDLMVPTVRQISVRVEVLGAAPVVQVPENWIYAGP